MTEAHEFLNKVANLYGWSDIKQIKGGDEVLSELEGKWLNQE